jgi:hypothetical protein
MSGNALNMIQERAMHVSESDESNVYLALLYRYGSS